MSGSRQTVWIWKSFSSRRRKPKRQPKMVFQVPVPVLQREKWSVYVAQKPVNIVAILSVFITRDHLFLQCRLQGVVARFTGVTLWQYTIIGLKFLYRPQVINIHLKFHKIVIVAWNTWFLQKAACGNESYWNTAGAEPPPPQKNVSMIESLNSNHGFLQF